jgi:hypothetical protein
MEADGEDDAEGVVYISRLTPVKILFRLRLQKISPGVILLMFLRVLTTV